MTPAEFKRKWARYSGKETAAYQEHFNDLCVLLDQPTPATANPTGSENGAGGFAHLGDGADHSQRELAEQIAASPQASPMDV